MAERHPNSRAHQPRDETLRHLLGRQGYEHDALAQRRQQISIARARAAKHVRIMHAGLIRREKWPLVMEPDHARLDASHSLYGIPREAHLLGPVAEQRGQ